LVPEGGEIFNWVESEKCDCTAGDIGFEAKGLRSWTKETGICSRDIFVNPESLLVRGRSASRAEYDRHGGVLAVVY
jgi:hypothetical protein